MDGVLLGLGHLLRSRPTIDSPDSVVADWYEAKATLLTHIANTASNAETAASSATQAEAARARASQLRLRADEHGQQTAAPERELSSVLRSPAVRLAQDTAPAA